MNLEVVQVDRQREEGGQQLTNNKEKKRKKIRRIKHVEGNFQTFIYVELLTSSQSQSESGSQRVEANSVPWLGHAQKNCLANMQHPKASPELIENPHISLSPLIMLRFHFIEPFLQAVGKIIREGCGGFTEEKNSNDGTTGTPSSSCRTTNSPFVSFPCYFDNVIDVYSNAEKNRFFSAIPVAEASKNWILALQTAFKNLSRTYDATNENMRTTTKRSEEKMDLKNGKSKLRKLRKTNCVEVAEQEVGNEEKISTREGGEEKIFLSKKKFIPRPHASLAWSLYFPSLVAASTSSTSSTSSAHSSVVVGATASSSSSSSMEESVVKGSSNSREKDNHREKFGDNCWPEALGKAITEQNSEVLPLVFEVKTITVQIGQRFHRFPLN